jgi:hypothetical protein
MLLDLGIAAGAKQFHATWYYFDEILTWAGVCATLGLAAGLIFGKKARIAGIAVAIAGSLMVFTSYEQTAFPLLGIFAVVIMEWVANEPRSLDLKRALFMWGALFAGASITGSAVSFPFALFSGRFDCTAFFTERLSALHACREDSKYGLFVNDGISLVERQIKGAADRLVVLNFSDPITFALGMTPQRGGAAGMHVGTTFDIQHHPSPERMFGDATLALVPEANSQSDSTLAMAAVYEPYLLAHFDLISTSKSWRLYRRFRD